MAAAQLSTIETQLIETIFTPKFAIGGWAPKTTPLCLEMRASTIENDITVIDSRWFGIKKRNGGGLASPPPYIGVGVSTIENGCSTIEHNWSTIESTWLDIKIRKRGGAGETFPRITLYMSVLYLSITFYSSIQYLRITFHTSVRYLWITTSIFFWTSYHVWVAGCNILDEFVHWCPNSSHRFFKINLNTSSRGLTFT